MKSQLITVLAAVVLVAAPATHALAAPNAESRAFLDRAAAAADARLAEQGVSLTGAAVRVRASFTPEGRVNHLEVAKSSGSRDTDAAVKGALRKLKLAYVPPGLAGRDVILTLGEAPIVEAKAR